MEEILKILIVDDDEVDRMAVRRSLKTAGIKMEVVEAINCQEAIASLSHDDFDCVFLDYRLPDGDGLSLVQNIRSSGFKAALVVLTGQGDEQIAVEVMKAGASDYISKSKVSPESLARLAQKCHSAESG
jgi:CheY-like chemotaxis protein